MQVLYLKKGEKASYLKNHPTKERTLVSLSANRQATKGLFRQSVRFNEISTRLVGAECPYGKPLQIAPNDKVAPRPLPGLGTTPASIKTRSDAFPRKASVGADRFQLSISRSRTVRDTELRYAPTTLSYTKTFLPLEVGTSHSF